MQTAMALDAVGYNSTVAAFTIFGLNPESMSAMNAEIWTNGISVIIQRIAQAPVPTKTTTILFKKKKYLKMSFNVQLLLQLT